MKIFASIKRCRPGGTLAKLCAEDRVLLPFGHLTDDVRCEAVHESRGLLDAPLLRHEVARLIVWHVVSTRPAVPSAVSYEVRQQGNALSKALGHGTHSHLTGTKTVR